MKKKNLDKKMNFQFRYKHEAMEGLIAWYLELGKLDLKDSSLWVSLARK